jgi:hypothetical protein
MELSLQSILKVFIAYALIYMFLGLVGVQWRMRLRIIAAMLIGTVLLGFLAWPLVRPLDPLEPVTIFTGYISLFDTLIFLILAYLSGLAAFFACTPHGCEIAPIAAPTGIAVWALGPGDMTALLRLNHTLAQQKQVYAVLKWEGLFWLAIIAAGFLGMLTAQVLTKTKPKELVDKDAHNSKVKKLLTIITAMILTVVLAHFVIGVFAQDVKMFNSELGSVVGQPSVAQIAFAVFISFTITSFVVKRFFDVGFIYSAIAAAGLTFFGITISAKADVLSYMVENWPVAFYTRATSAILPIQMISFAALGSVAGYWTAIRFAHWRRDVSKGLNNSQTITS